MDASTVAVASTLALPVMAPMTWHVASPATSLVAAPATSPMMSSATSSMMSSATSPASPAISIVASWSGYAQADPTLVGVVVAAIAIFSVVYVLKRVLGERRPGRSGGPRPGSKPARARSR